MLLQVRVGKKGQRVRGDTKVQFSGGKQVQIATASSSSRNCGGSAFMLHACNFDLCSCEMCHQSCQGERNFRQIGNSIQQTGTLELLVLSRTQKLVQCVFVIFAHSQNMFLFLSHNCCVGMILVQFSPCWSFILKWDGAFSFLLIHSQTALNECECAQCARERERERC